MQGRIGVLGQDAQRSGGTLEKTAKKLGSVFLMGSKRKLAPPFKGTKDGTFTVNDLGCCSVRVRTKPVDFRVV